MVRKVRHNDESVIEGYIRNSGKKVKWFTSALNAIQCNNRKAQGTLYYQENTIERHLYGGAGWLVWGGIILGPRTELHVQNVTMTGHIYRDVILEQLVRLFRGTMGA
ncbi:transposable element Tc3 transposase [Trichonephila clavipes]|nr:transposable element Tc3 transposase [Trichonephila clavipes]